MPVNEPKELRPFVIFGARPPLNGQVGIVRDFRAMPVDANDALPPRAPEVKAPDPKPQVSSVTEPAVGETTVVKQSPENPVPVAALPPSLQRPPLTTGVVTPPAEATTEAPAPSPA